MMTGIFKMPGERMLAHVKIDQKRQRLVCITCHPEDLLLPKSSMCVYGKDRIRTSAFLPVTYACTALLWGLAPSPGQLRSPTAFEHAHIYNLRIPDGGIPDVHMQSTTRT